MHLVLDRDPPHHPKGAQPPIFGPCLLWPNAGWITMPLGTEVGLGSGHIVLGPAPGPAPPPPPKGAEQLPLFSAHHVYCGQMVAHLSYC